MKPPRIYIVTQPPHCEPSCVSGAARFFFIFVFGISLSLNYKRDRNIYTVIIFHTLKNIVAFAFLFKIFKSRINRLTKKNSILFKVYHIMILLYHLSL